MARNKITDLNNHLFEQLERLNDEELTPDEMEHEEKRTKSISIIASNIIKTHKIHLDSIVVKEKFEVGVSESFNL